MLLKPCPDDPSESGRACSAVIKQFVLVDADNVYNTIVIFETRYFVDSHAAKYSCRFAKHKWKLSTISGEVERIFVQSQGKSGLEEYTTRHFLGIEHHEVSSIADGTKVLFDGNVGRVEQSAEAV